MTEKAGYFFSFAKMDYVSGKRPSGCILCSLRGKRPDAPGLIVHRDPLFLATVNLYPYNPGHLLVFPRRHIVDLRELTPREAARLHELTTLLVAALDRVYTPAGYNIGYNMGRTAGASIAHLHQHIIPRFRNEIGIADLLAGKRVLVEDPRVSAGRLTEALAQLPRS